MAGFQILLIASGNLAFFNWLTLVPVLALFDDDLLVRCAPGRLRGWLDARRSTASGTGPRIWVACVAALVAVKSVPVVANLASHHQAMNRSYDRLALVNTYGAFGSVGRERHELVLEGTRERPRDADPATARWSAYELPCKPGDPARRPCLLGPYHMRLDWLIWFAAMSDEPRDPWVLHLVWKLLDGDRAIRQLLAADPVRRRGAALRADPEVRLSPRAVRQRDLVDRDHEELWLPPIAQGSPELRDALAPYGMPSPSLR